LSEVTRKDAAGDYAELCEMLMEPTFPVGPAQVQLSDAEVQVAFRSQRADLPRMSRRSRKLAPIAREYASLLDRADQLQTNSPNAPALGVGLGEAVIGLYAGGHDLALEGGTKAIAEVAKAVDEYPKLKGLSERKHELEVELSELAPLFSGPTSEEKTFRIEIREHRPGYLETETRDAVLLTNITKRDLHSCVVRIRVSDDTHTSYLHLHFAGTWPAGQTRALGYTSSDLMVPRFDSIARFEIQVFSTEETKSQIDLLRPNAGWPPL